ncbi:MAG: glycerol-3-phosphate dehydrogenase [Pseudomonadota bacterium]
MTESDDIFDVAIIGGGINGCGIARDAAGRGLSVFLCEQGDLGQGTSSASTKLIHGGLRYLEFLKFRLVREALVEREVLLRAVPHIAWPMRFVLPHNPGLRPAWLVRFGLFLYDNLGGRRLLPATQTLDLQQDKTGEPLKPSLKRAFEYSDCWIDDARLVVLNARDAEARGATIAVGTTCVLAERRDGLWQVTLEDGQTGATRQIQARCLINAGGPWVDDIIRYKLHRNAPAHTRLVRGSHLVVARQYEHDKSYIFQMDDGRIVFAIPYEDDFTLIGTTEMDHDGSPETATCTAEERAYLLNAANAHFSQPVEEKDIVWTYSGVRPLYDDGARSSTKATRDYVLMVDTSGGITPLLNVFGGKITTYRRLAEAALAKLKQYLPSMGEPWTADTALPGGNMPVDAHMEAEAKLCADYPFLDEPWARRLVRTYGSEAAAMLGNAHNAADLGRSFGSNLTEAEVRWLMENEWACSAEDVLWRRTKLGLRLTEGQARDLDLWMRGQATRTGRDNMTMVGKG